jgi:hypothetical protein
MRKILSKCLLAVGVGAMAMLPQGCKRAVPAPTSAAVPRKAPAPRFEPFPVDDGGAVGNTVVPPQPARHRQRVDTPQVVQTAVNNQPTDAELAAQQREQDAGLLQQQQAASQRQQQELNRMVEQSQKAQEQQDDDPRIQEAPGPAPAPRIQDAPGPAPAPRIQDAPGPSQTLPPPEPEPAPPEM